MRPILESMMRTVLAACLLAGASAAPAAAQDKRGGAAVAPAPASPADQAAVLAAYRERFVREAAAQPEGDAARAAALQALAADPIDATASDLIGDYDCAVYGAIDDYLGESEVLLYRSGAFRCVIPFGGALRFQKTTGSPLDLPIREAAPGVFVFDSDYHSGLIKPVRAWHIEAIDADTIRILPYEPDMAAELANDAVPLTGVDMNIFVLTRR